MDQGDRERQINELREMFYSRVNMQGWTDRLGQGLPVIARNRLGAYGELQKEGDEFFIALPGEEKRKLDPEGSADFIGASIEEIQQKLGKRP